MTAVTITSCWALATFTRTIPFVLLQQPSALPTPPQPRHNITSKVNDNLKLYCIHSRSQTSLQYTPNKRSLAIKSCSLVLLNDMKALHLAELHLPDTRPPIFRIFYIMGVKPTRLLGAGATVNSAGAHPSQSRLAPHAELRETTTSVSATEAQDSAEHWNLHSEAWAYV
jgi:hypothetical protein